VAYAEKQAALLDRLAHSSAECWLPVLKAHGITPSWGADYVVVIEDDQIPVPAADEDEWEDVLRTKPERGKDRKRAPGPIT
jgi:hypothetical protein